MKGTIFKIRLSKSNIFALIPAPMKGTISFFYNNALIPIPTKGTMPGSFKRVFNYKCFNLRTREGYDRYRLAGPPQMYSFNPRTHEGYDMSIYLLTLLSSRFNPRIHEGYDYSLL